MKKYTAENNKNNRGNSQESPWRLVRVVLLYPGICLSVLIILLMYSKLIGAGYINSPPELIPDNMIYIQITPEAAKFLELPKKIDEVDLGSFLGYAYFFHDQNVPVPAYEYLFFDSTDIIAIKEGTKLSLYIRLKYGYGNLFDPAKAVTTALTG